MSEGYEQLLCVVVAGKFERNGRSRVFYLHPSGVRVKMTRERMTNINNTFIGSTIERQYLACCWIPRDMAILWSLTQNMSVAGWPGGVPGPDYEEAIMAAMQDLCERQGKSARQASQILAKAIGRVGNSPEADAGRSLHSLQPPGSSKLLRNRWACLRKT